MPNNQHRMSTTIHSRPITPEYAKGWEWTFGRTPKKKDPNPMVITGVNRRTKTITLRSTNG